MDVLGAIRCFSCTEIWSWTAFDIRDREWLHHRRRRFEMGQWSNIKETWTWNDLLYAVWFTNVLVIDPSQEFARKLAANIKEYPEKLGQLFENIGITNGTPANGTAKSPNRDHDRTMYEDSIAKYGKMVFTAIDLHIPPNLVLPYHSHSSNKEISSTVKTKVSVPSFVVAAAAQNCSVSVIYHLMRKNIGSTTALC